jgi:hypothetical protein
MSPASTVRQVRRVAALAALCIVARGAAAGPPTAAGAPGDPARIVAIAGTVAQDTEGARHAAAAPVARVAASRSDGFFVAPGRDAVPVARRPSPKPEDRAPAAAEALDEPVSGPVRAMLVLAGLIGWIAARRSR